MKRMKTRTAIDEDFDTRMAELTSEGILEQHNGTTSFSKKFSDCLFFALQPILHSSYRTVDEMQVELLVNALRIFYAPHRKDLAFVKRNVPLLLVQLKMVLEGIAKKKGMNHS